MIRSQILLTPDLVAEVKKIAQKQGISQSEAVRELLNRALGGRTNDLKIGKEGTPEEYLYDLASFSSANPRIDGFKEIYSVGGRTTEIRILSDYAFRFYLKNKKLPEELEYRILKECRELVGLSETKTIVARRAYVVPGLENPPGPRFLGLKINEVIDAIKEVFNFAIEHEYYLKKMSQICAFFYPFADPKPLSLPIKTEAVLPYGGYAVPLNKIASRVEVFGVWGNNEGVQSFDAIDRYIVDTQRKIIIEKETPQKMLMLCTTEKSQSDKISVPHDRQFEQVLNDAEILEIGRVVKELTEKYGLRRVEFSYDGRTGIIFNESVPYVIYDKEIKRIDKRGMIKTVAGYRDVEKLRLLLPEEVERTIIYIDKKIVEDRAYDILNSVAALSNKFTVFYPGLSATAHAMRVLNDFGHTAIVVGNRTFKEGEEVIVKVQGDQVLIDRVLEGSMKNFVVNLHDAKLYGRELTGGKAMNISLLKAKGFNVPHGVVLTTNFFNKIVAATLAKNHLSQEIKPSIFNLKFEISTDLWQQILKASGLSSKEKYAVRSSANVEDQAEHSFAGQFVTFLKVDYQSLKEKVAAVIKSTFDPRVARYTAALSSSKGIKMAVVIQQMVEAERSGVVFGKDIQTGDEDLIVIDVACGLGEGVVDGTSQSQRIIYSRSKNTLINNSAKQKQSFLSRIEIDSLIEMTLSIERLMGGVQDIEWAIDKKGDIWLIQTRDL